MSRMRKGIYYTDTQKALMWDRWQLAYARSPLLGKTLLLADAAGE